MCFSDFVRALQGIGIRATASQIRWAMASGKVTKPLLDGSLNLVFSNEHIKEFHEYFDNLKMRQTEGKAHGNLRQGSR